MDNPFQIFTSPIFGSVRAAILDNQIWFVGKDVARALGYERGDMAINRHVDIKDRKILFVATFQSMKEGKSVKRRTIVINESGLYSLTLSSNMPRAQEFKHWVTSEVLPSIRKTGSYSLFAKADSDDAVQPEVPSSPPLTLADKLIEVARLMEPSPERNKILLHAANLIAGKNIF